MNGLKRMKNKKNKRFVDVDFLERAEKIAKPKIKEYLESRRKKINKWNNENREKLRISIKNYSLSETGKAKNREKIRFRNKIIKDSLKELEKEEIEKIKSFYRNKPEGYVVDHIFPISKGGKHVLSNLQYLTLAENSSKNNKII